MKFTMETIRKIYCDEDDKYIEVGPDIEGYGLVEIRYKEDGYTTQSISFTPVQAQLIIEAMQECIKDMEQNREGKDE